jgi:glycerophosphoryl diester phosphodiesterase
VADRSYLPPGPIAFAHRGGADEAPENTLPAFEHAVSLGYTYLETDVHLTRDGVVMAFHDDRLDRVTDTTGLISDLTAAQVEAADAGYRYTPDGGLSFPFRGTGIRVPRLEDVLSRFHDARVNIDPKNDAVVVPLLAVLRSLDALDRVCIGSFSGRRLGLIRRLTGGRVCTSMGPAAVAAARFTSWAGGIPSKLGADCVQLPVRSRGIRLVDRRFVSACHRRGLPVHVWTVNDPGEMERLLDLGVDGIMTDHPAALAEIFRRRGLPLDGSRPG